MKKTFVALCTLLVLNGCTPAIKQDLLSDYNNSKLVSGIVNYSAPKEWQEKEPSSEMRLAEYLLPGADGSESAELAVFLFPQSGGSVEDNLERWYSQFIPEEEMNQSPKTQKFNLGKLPITTLYLSGTYLQNKFPMMPDGPKIEHANFAMLAAIAETADGPWFFKAIGPKATIDQHQANFDQFVKSFRLK